MKKLTIINFVLLSSLLFFFSCKKDNAGMALNLNGNVDISSFTVDTANGAIDTANGKIAIYLPFATDFTKVTPTITLPVGATVNPASGTAVNMTNPVQFRVINGNIYKDYTVTAKETP